MVARTVWCLNKNGPHGPICLNTWITVGKDFGKDLEVQPCWRTYVIECGLEISKDIFHSQCHS